MDLVELWVLLNTWYEEYQYNGHRLTQLQRQFPQVKSNTNETETITGLQSS